LAGNWHRLLFLVAQLPLAAAMRVDLSLTAGRGAPRGTVRATNPGTARNEDRAPAVAIDPAAAPGRSTRCALGFFLPVLLLLAAGCKLVKDTAELPVKAVAAAVPKGPPGTLDPGEVQTEALGYADDFAGRTTVAIDEYARRVGSAAGRAEALRWKVQISASTVSVATGPNPTVNVLDLVALASLTRRFVEVRAGQPAASAAFEPWVATSRLLETSAWALAARVLATNHQAEFRAEVDRWCAENGAAAGTFFARPQDFISAIRRLAEPAARPDSVFRLIGLDPMAGLDPAVREVVRARLFAERALYAAQRMVFTFRWQTEVLADQLLERESVSRAVASADRLSRAAESASQTAALLPDRLAAERQAILAAIETQEGRLRELAGEVARTLAAGQGMATSLDATLRTFDALMKRFGVGEHPTAPPQTNATPFRILDYAEAADHIATLAQQLEALLKTTGSTLDSPALDRRLTDLDALRARARADAESVLNRAFLFAAGLIVLAGGIVVGVRRADRRSGPTAAHPMRGNPPGGAPAG
jgi:hypothetical protein